MRSERELLLRRNLEKGQKQKNLNFLNVAPIKNATVHGDVTRGVVVSDWQQVFGREFEGE